ncbi:MAG TPA: hypothetical protein VH268_13565 [Solirubrobacterales bacterium]|jgi:hypothetical protein|nr:hypothetical protein [Solirubrobacterales bacterium]
MTTTRPFGLTSLGIAAIAILSFLAYASPAQASRVANAVIAGGAAPRISWTAADHTPSVSGVLKGKNCSVKVNSDETLRNVRITVGGKKGAARLLPKSLLRIQHQTVRAGDFQCAVDTTLLPNGPVTLTATAVDASDEKKSATKEIVVANPESVPSAPAAATAAAAGSRWFSPTSIWNRELPGNAQLASKSPAFVSELVRQVNSAGPWINTDQYSVPVYTVPADQPTVRVIQRGQNNYVNAAMNTAFAAVPVPPDAQPAAGTDKHMVVYQPSTDKMWEFWEMEKQNGQWTAMWGAAIQNVSENKGYIDSSAWAGAESDWGATATSLPLAGGLMRISELEAGHIDHALALAIPEPSPEHVWPAQRSDGWDTSSTAIPEGTIFRLPANLNIAALHLPKLTEEMAIAAQRYGIVVRDTSGCVCFYGEDPTPVGGNPYNKIFEGQYPNQLLAHFPFASLQAVQPGT